MEKWERPRPPPHRGGAGGQPEKPSFSSTLLDAIYRSIDRDDTNCESHHPSLPRSTTTTTTTRKQTAASTDRRRSYTSITTSSSSDSSSYGGFSSSDTEPSLRHSSLRPVRTAPPPPPPERKNRSIGSRLRELRRAKPPAPASPGVRLASFLNSLFTAKKPRSGTELRSPEARPCLSKASSLRERPPRSVRFDPVTVVVPSGRRCCVPAAAPPRREVKETVAEVLRRFEEDDGGETDSSSDLFELDNLKDGIGRGGGGQYRDELPVFETTHIRAHRAPSLRF